MRNFRLCKDAKKTIEYEKQILEPWRLWSHEKSNEPYFAFLIPIFAAISAPQKLLNKSISFRSIPFLIVNITIEG